MSQKAISKGKKAKTGVREFASGVQCELRKVDWPAMPVVTRASFIIIIMLIFFTTLVAIYDMGFSKILISLKGI